MNRKTNKNIKPGECRALLNQLKTLTYENFFIKSSQKGHHPFFEERKYNTLLYVNNTSILV